MDIAGKPIGYRFLVYMAVLFCVVRNSWSISETELQIRLMDGYNKNVPPPTGDGGPLLADLEMYLFSITHFDEVLEVLTTNSFLQVYWVDERLKWSLDDTNRTHTYFRQDQLWVPDLVVVNSVDEYKYLGYDSLMIRIDNRGFVTWGPGLNARTVCEINTEYFPFDTQLCTVQIVPWAQSRPHSDVISSRQSVYVDPQMLENGLWKLSNSSIDTRDIGSATMLLFNLVLERRPDYYVTAILMPVFVLSVLNCFTFVLPQSSGEKMTFSTTILLSYTVLMTYTNEYLPKTSKYTSIFVNYIAVMLGLSCISVICTVLGMITYKHDIKPDSWTDSRTECVQTQDSIRDTDTQHDKGIDGIMARLDEGTTDGKLGGNRTTATKERRHFADCVSVKYYVLLFLGYFVKYFMFACVILATTIVTALTFKKLG